METQKTILKSCSLSGKGLQTGKDSEVFFYPEEPDKGISFQRKDLPSAEPITIGQKELKFSANRRSIVGKGKNSVETVEHVLASLSGLGIDNIRIEITTSEPPALDGSARVFAEALQKAGIKEQGREKKYISIITPLWVEEKEAFLGVFPSDKFKISFLMEAPAWRQLFSGEINEEVFKKEIAPARTIWFVPSGPGTVEQKAEFAKGLGYGRGANKENVLLISEGKPLNETRFPDEPVRHKVLDLIGDLYLLGRPLKARVIAIRSGHKLNLKLVEKIKKEYL